MLRQFFQKKMVDQDRFAAGPYVAIWIGHHKTEAELDAYLDSGKFSEEHRFRLNERMPPEISVETSPKPLRELVNGFSHFEKFQDEFLARAAELGITDASSMLVFYFMVYSPDGLPISQNPEMRFVGNFWFEGFG